MKQNDCAVNSVHCYLYTQPAALINRRENCEVEATEKVETEWNNGVRIKVLDKISSRKRLTSLESKDKRSRREQR